MRLLLSLLVLVGLGLLAYSLLGSEAVGPESVLGTASAPSSADEGDAEGPAAVAEVEADAQERQALAVDREPKNTGEPVQGATVDPTPQRVTVTVKEGGGRRLIGGRTLPGLQVELFRIADPGKPLGSARSDADGAAVFSVPLGHLDADARGLTGVRARVVEPGYLTRPMTVRRFVRDGQTSFAGSVYAAQGWTQPLAVTGDVSREQIQVIKERGARLSPDDRCSIRETPNGSFEVKVAASEDRLWVLVDAGDQGTAAAKLVAPPGGDVPPEPLILELGGAARLTGILLGADDRPAPPAQLRVTLQPDGQPVDFDESGSALATQLTLEGAGRFQVRGKSAPDGAFHFGGLRPGQYRVEALGFAGSPAAGGETSQSWVQLATVIAAENSAPLELRHTRPAIVVHVEPGPEGEACDLLLYDAGAIGSAPWVEAEDWGHWLPVARPLAHLHASGRYRHVYDGRLGVIEVPPGRQYLLVAKGIGYDSTPRLIEVPRENPLVSVEVQFHDLPPAPRLVVHVVFDELDLDRLEELVPRDVGEDHPSRRYPRWSKSVKDFGLIVEDPTTGLPLASSSWVHGEPHSFEFRVRPGPVRIVGVSLAWTDRQHGTVLNSNGFGRSRVLAEVRPDRGTEMELTMRMGGVLEVELQGALRAADTAALEDKIAALEARGKYVDREYLERESSAALFLEDHLGRRAEPVTRIALSNLHSSAAGRHVMNEWPLGETHISEVLTPGTYTLRATFEGRPSVTKQVTIVAGQRSRVTLDLGR